MSDELNKDKQFQKNFALEEGPHVDTSLDDANQPALTLWNRFKDTFLCIKTKDGLSTGLVVGTAFCFSTLQFAQFQGLLFLISQMPEQSQNETFHYLTYSSISSTEILHVLASTAQSAFFGLLGGIVFSQTLTFASRQLAFLGRANRRYHQDSRFSKNATIGGVVTGVTLAFFVSFGTFPPVAQACWEGVNAIVRGDGVSPMLLYYQSFHSFGLLGLGGVFGYCGGRLSSIVMKRVTKKDTNDDVLKQ